MWRTIGSMVKNVSVGCDHAAPWSIQPRIKPISPRLRAGALPSGGISVSSTKPAIMWTSGLLALSPGRIATPSSPPLSADSRLVNRKSLLGRLSPWHLRQERFSKGWMSVAKSTLRSADIGSLPGSTGSCAIAPAPLNRMASSIRISRAGAG